MSLVEWTERISWELVSFLSSPLKIVTLVFLYSQLLISASGLEHVRVHPKFLHSNATSHKWALGGMVFIFVSPCFCLSCFLTQTLKKTQQSAMHCLFTSPFNL